MIHSRLDRLQGAAERTARALLKGRKTRVVTGSNTCCWDPKADVIYLPGFDAEPNPDDPATYSAFRGTLDHECGHPLFTEMEVVERYLKRWQAQYPRHIDHLKGLWNSFEDVFIERKMGERYAGSISNFRAMRAWAIRGYGATSAGAITDPSFSHREHTRGQPIGPMRALTTVIYMVPPGTLDLAAVHPDTLEVFDLCKAEIEEGWAAQDSEACCRAAEAVFKQLMSISEEPDEPEEEEGNGEGEGPEGEGEGSEGEGEGSEGEGEGSEGGGTPGSGSGSDAEEGGDGSDAEGAGPDGPGDGGEAEGSRGPQTLPPGEHERSEGTADGGDSLQGGLGRAHTAEERETAIAALGGEMGALPDMGTIVSKALSTSVMSTGYTVDPATQAKDELIRYTRQERALAAPSYRALKQTAGPLGAKLARKLHAAFAASRQVSWVGGLEDGDDLDPAAIAGIASGTAGAGIFGEWMRGLDENTGVLLLVDCSGSMGSSVPGWKCSKDPDHPHGVDTYRPRRRARGSAPPPPVKGDCGVCGSPVKPFAASKAAHAAVTASMLHEALKQCGVRHAAAGFTTGRGWSSGSGARFSRSSCTQSIRVFVEAPGNGDGSALTHIDGYAANLDGESLMWGLRYAAAEFSECDRVIVLMISDGLPAGADDHIAENVYLHKVVQQASQAGIEVYAIGIGISKASVHYEGKAYASAYDYYYPQSKGKGGAAPTGHVLLDRQGGLTNTVLTEITKLITRGHGQTRKGKLG